MERRAIQIAVLVLTAIVLLSVLWEYYAVDEWCFPDDSATQAERY